MSIDNSALANAIYGNDDEPIEVTSSNEQVNNENEVKTTEPTEEVKEEPTEQVEAPESSEKQTEPTEPTEQSTEIVEQVETPKTETKPEVKQEKSYTEKQFNGLLADKQAEVKKRQELQTQLDNLKQEQVKLMALVQNTAPSQVYEGLEQDDPLTVKDLQKIDAAKAQKLQVAQEDLTSKTVEITAQLQLQKAKEKFTKEFAGEGLSFDEVMKTGKDLSKNELAEIYDILVNGGDAAEFAYQRRIDKTPELKEKQLSNLIDKKIKEMAKGKVVPTAQTTKAVKPATKVTQDVILNSSKSIVAKVFGNDDD